MDINDQSSDESSSSSKSSNEREERNDDERDQEKVWNEWRLYNPSVAIGDQKETLLRWEEAQEMTRGRREWPRWDDNSLWQKSYASDNSKFRTRADYPKTIAELIIGDIFPEKYCFY
eukprot:514193_1